MAAQLTATNERAARALRRWMRRATSSLPVPDSPMTNTLDPAHGPLDEGQTIAFMQSINALRVVLGSMLDITDDESAQPSIRERARYRLDNLLARGTVATLAPLGIVAASAALHPRLIEAIAQS